MSSPTSNAVALGTPAGETSGLPSDPAGAPAATSSADPTAAELDAARVEAARIIAAQEQARRAAPKGKGKRKAPELVAVADPAPVDPPELAQVDEPVGDERTDRELVRDLRATLVAVVSLVALVARLFGRPFDALTGPEADEGARAWLPLARRYPLVARLTIWAAAPAWLASVVTARLPKREGSSS